MKRDVGRNESDDALWLTVIFTVAAILAAVWFGGWLAARTVGADLGVGPAKVIGVITEMARHLADPRLAWPEPARSRLPGPWIMWPATILCLLPWLTALVVMARRGRVRFGLADRERLGVKTEARLATVKDIEPVIVAGPTRGRFVIGTAHGQLVATESPTQPAPSARRSAGRAVRGSLMAVGPSQCGKTTMAIGGVLVWDGPAVLSSVKTDMLNATINNRRQAGDCKVFDPADVTGHPRSSWSPLRAASTVDGAKAAARALVDSAPHDGVERSVFWQLTAEIILSGYLWVAATSGLGMRDVVRWVVTQDAPTTNNPGEVQTLLLPMVLSDNLMLAADATLVAEALGGVWNLEERTRSGIFGTAQTAIWPWTSPTVVGTSDTTDVNLEWLTSGNNTLYLSAPLRAARRLAPALGGLLSDLFDQIAEHVSRTGQPLDPPLLVVLDEVGNTPLRDLPELVSTLAGMGVQLVTIWQSVAQINAAYKTNAGTILANHRTKIFYSGISDPDTYDTVHRLVGDEQIVNRQLTSDLGSASGSGARRSLAESTTTSTLIPGHVLRQQPTSSALCIHGTVPPFQLTPQPPAQRRKS